MLAYVFWHWHRAQIDAHTYEEQLIAFHRTLGEHKPHGFHYSKLLSMQSASWLDRTGRTYEDWNIVEGSAALDPLNHDAVTGACLEPHNRVARLAAGGTGGLYSLCFGDMYRDTVRFAYRFNKPAGMTYAQLYEQLRFLEERHTGDLWIRQMNLGPGPEFCLHSSEEIAVPENVRMLKIPVKQIWSGTQS
jgi:hypothetical protein